MTKKMEQKAQSGILCSYYIFVDQKKGLEYTSMDGLSTKSILYMSLAILKNKMKTWAEDLKLTQDDIKELDTLGSVNELIGGMSLLYRVLLHVRGQKLDELFAELQTLEATVTVKELFKLQQVSARKSIQNANLLVFSATIEQSTSKKGIEIGRYTIPTLFQAAIDHQEGIWVEFLINNKLVDFDLSTDKAPSHLQSGFWIRHFSHHEIADEIGNLQKRQALSELALHSHSPQSRDTPQSCATFIYPGYNISLFANSANHTGVILGVRNRVIDYWQSGFGGELTQEPNDAKKMLNQYATEDEYHFRNINEKTLFEQYPKWVRDSQVFKGKLDRYNIIEKSTILPCNKGQFSYVTSEISGLFVNPNNCESIQAAFKLRRALVKEFNLTPERLPYYAYDQKNRSLIRLTTPELEECLKKAQESLSKNSRSAMLFKRILSNSRAGILPDSNDTAHKL